MNDLIIPLDSSSKAPMYEQIYQYIKKEIKNGNLPFHGRLPSTRVLARHMDVSRSTVDMAYTQLIAEGYLEAVPCKGYYVAQIDELFVSRPMVKKAEQAPQTADELCLYDFSPRGIDLENFPYNVWRKLTKNILTDGNRELFGSGLSKGDLELRETICDYLHRARGVNCSPEQMIIGAGNEYLLMRLNQLLLPGSVIAMENPTYKQAYRIFKSLGHPVAPISMDDSGMRISELNTSSAELAYVMPSHQYPLGIVMPIKRRMELLSWAEGKTGRYIIEDDYDSQFRYRGKPIPSLQGVDAHDRVIYIGTFSQAIAPAIRVSYMVLPNSLLEAYRGFDFFSSTVSRIDQAVIGAFLREGYFERHLNRMRGIYKSKHDILVSSFKDSRQFAVSGEHAGIHILLTDRTGRQEKELIRLAGRAGVKVYGLSEYYIDPPKMPSHTVVLGYANMPEEKLIQGTALLKRAWNVTK